MGTNWLHLSGSGWVATPDTAVLDITGDIDIRAAVALTDWTPSVQQCLVSKYLTPNDQSYGFQTLSDGTLNNFWDDDGTGAANSRSSTAATGFADASLHAIRTTRKNGTLEIKFFYKTTTASTALADCASDAGWTQLGSTVADAITVSAYSGSAPLIVGALGGGILGLIGDVYAVVVKNGINGTTVANPDFTEQTHGTTSFIDSAGRTWTLQGDAEFQPIPSPPTPPATVSRNFPTMLISVAFNAGASTGTALVFNDATRGKFDTGTFGEDVLYFSEISPWVRSFSINRPSSRVVGPVLRYEAGTASAVLNNADRRFDPTNLDGPYVTAGISQVRAMRLVRYQAVWKGVPHYLFQGYADDWPVTFAKSLRNSEVVLSATDGMKLLEASDRAAVAAVGAGEDTGARIDRILDSAGWSAVDRAVNSGQTTVQATTLEGSALSEIQLTSDTEIGQFFIDPAGTATYRDRHAPMTEPLSTTSQATFGTAAGELPFYDVKISTDIVQLVNRASITRVGGTTTWQADDPDSQAEYLVHAYSRTDLIMDASDTKSADYAAFIVYQCKDPELRFDEMVVKPMRSPDLLFPQVLGRAIGERITIILRPQNGPTIQRDCFISGIAHDVNYAEQDWTTTFTLQSATKYALLVFDSPTLGVFDQDAFAY